MARQEGWKDKQDQRIAIDPRLDTSPISNGESLKNKKVWMQQQSGKRFCQAEAVYVILCCVILIHTTIGCGKQGFPSAQPYLSHTPAG